MKVKLSELRRTVNDGVAKLGYTNEDAAVIAEVLLYAQLRRNNQGIAKLATGGVPKAADVPAYKIVKRSKCGALVSGGHAMVAANNAVKLAAELAAEHGVGIVGSHHTFTSSGAIGYFARKIADLGYIGLVCVGTPPFVAPFGSAEPKLGTNPLSYAFPTNNGSVVFDTTTAAMAYFGVVEANLKGQPIPEGIGFDSEGDPTTDAAKVIDGSVSTFAGHKGFGLSLLVQLLGGPFVDASFANENEEKGSGTFALALDPGLFVDKDRFMEQATKLTDSIKAAKPLGSEKILLPGERGDNLAKEAGLSGEIEISDAIWNELVAFVGE